LEGLNFLFAFIVRISYYIPNSPSGRFLLTKTPFMKIVEYIKDTKGEMKHVTWPTRKQSVNYTLLVIGISVGVAILLAIADYVFSLGLENIILNK